MKTTLELPDELMRTVKIRAVREDRKLKDMVAELLRRGLAAEPHDRSQRGHRVQLPLIRSRRPTNPDDEMTPERVAEILLAGELPET